jgi:short-subunit dehydrogenase
MTRPHTTPLLQEKLQTLNERLSQTAQVKTTYRAVDIGDFESVSAVSSSAQEMGGIDILINNVC